MKVKTKSYPRKHKLLLSTLSLTVAVTPVATVLACGDESSTPVTPANPYANSFKESLTATGKTTVVGNTIITGTNIADFGLTTDDLLTTTLSDVEKTKVKEAVKGVTLHWTGYDFNKKVLNGTLEVVFNDDTKVATLSKSVTITGFADPKVTPASGDTIAVSEFANLVLPTSFTIPATVTTIAYHAFTNAHLPEGFVIPDSVLNISGSVFVGVTLPASFVVPKVWATTIPILAFEGATLPVGFQIPDTVTAIGNLTSPYSVFKDAILPVGFVLPKAWVPIILNHAFQNTTLPVGFQIPDTVTEISLNAFDGATLPEGFSIPSNVHSIGNDDVYFGSGAFIGTKLPASFGVPQAWTPIIPTYAFQGSILPTGFQIPDTVKTINTLAFVESHLPAGFTIPTTVTTINSDAFKDHVIPTGYKWVNKDGQNITGPTAGGDHVVPVTS